MNLIQQQNYLEYANKDDLIKMMSEPVSSISFIFSIK
jgi:hypothetical protein